MTARGAYYKNKLYMEVMHSNICAYLLRVKMEGRLCLRGKRNHDWSGCFAHIKSFAPNVERGNVENGRSERQGIGFLIRHGQRLGSEQDESL